jgi:hypothetical protein
MTTFRFHCGARGRGRRGLPSPHGGASLRVQRMSPGRGGDAGWPGAAGRRFAVDSHGCAELVDVGPSWRKEVPLSRRPGGRVDNACGESGTGHQIRGGETARATVRVGVGKNQELTRCWRRQTESDAREGRSWGPYPRTLKVRRLPLRQAGRPYPIVQPAREPTAWNSPGLGWDPARYEFQGTANMPRASPASKVSG